MNGQMAELLLMKARLRAKAGKGVAAGKSQREPVTSIAKVVSDRSRKNSRRKGNRGELDVAEMFSRWSGERVRRTPGSGGWGGSKDFGTTADIVCSKKAWPFSCEIKHREGWVLDDLVTGARRDHDKSIRQWWIQCCAAVPRAKNGAWKKEPLLVFRRNRQPWLVMMRTARVDCSLQVSQVTTVLYDLDGEDVGVTVMLLETFLKHEPVPNGLRGHR